MFWGWLRVLPISIHCAVAALSSNRFLLSEHMWKQSLLLALSSMAFQRDMEQHLQSSMRTMHVQEPREGYMVKTHRCISKSNNQSSNEAQTIQICTDQVK